MVSDSWRPHGPPGFSDYYNIQKIRAGGFQKPDKDGKGVDEVGAIEKIFQTLDLMIDDNSNVNYDMFK